MGFISIHVSLLVLKHQYNFSTLDSFGSHCVLSGFLELSHKEKTREEILALLEEEDTQEEHHAQRLQVV